MQILERLLLQWGGSWALVVMFLGVVAYHMTPSHWPLSMRLRAGLMKNWFLVTSTVIGAMSWLTAYWHLWNGAWYLPAAGDWAWLPPGLLVGLGLITGAAFWSVSSFRRFKPWPTLISVGLLIVLSNPIFAKAPEINMIQGEQGRHVRYVQQRLAGLGCFDSARVTRRTDGYYGVETYHAVLAFQQRNQLITAQPDQKYLGQIRPAQEFRMLTHPLPMIDGPSPCRS